MATSVCEQLCKLKAERGVSYKWLAARLGVTPDTVTRWAKGKNLPSPEHLPELARLFNVSSDELLGLDPPVARPRVPIVGRATSGPLAEEERAWKDLARLTVDDLEIRISVRRRGP